MRKDDPQSMSAEDLHRMLVVSRWVAPVLKKYSGCFFILSPSLQLFVLKLIKLFPRAENDVSTYDMTSFSNC